MMGSRPDIGEYDPAYRECRPTSDGGEIHPARSGYRSDHHVELRGRYGDSEDGV